MRLLETMVETNQFVLPFLLLTTINCIWLFQKVGQVLSNYQKRQLAYVKGVNNEEEEFQI